MPDTSCQRDPGLDLIRVVSIVLIIILHSWSILGFNVGTGTLQYHLYGNTAVYGLGMFTILSGALQMKRPLPVTEYYKKRFARILIPFLFWATIVYIISAVVGKYDGIDSASKMCSSYIPFLLTNKINAAYWYVYLIAALYFLTPALMAIFPREKRLTRWILPALILIWLVIESTHHLSGVAGTFVLYLGYYLTGCYISRYLTDKKMCRNIGMVGVALFSPLFIALFDKDSFSSLFKTLDIISLYLLLSSFGTDVNFIRQSSTFCYTIYLTHFVCIGALAAMAPVFFSSNILMPLLVALITFILEYVFCLSLSKCKYIPDFVVGI